MLIDSQWQSVDGDSPLLEALVALPPYHQKAIYLRFWENFSIGEIASSLKLTWEQTDKLIEESLLRLNLKLTQSNIEFLFKQAS